MFATEWSAEQLTYQDAPFRAEVTGTLNGVAFRGLVEAAFVPREAGVSEAAERVAADGRVLVHSLTYSEPPALAGITVSDATGGAALPDGSTLSGNGTLQGEPDAPDVRGWLLPVTAFSLRGTLYPVEEEHGSGADAAPWDGTVLRTEQDGRIYTLYLRAEDDRPARVVAETPGGDCILDLRVVWFDASGAAEGGE